MSPFSELSSHFIFLSYGIYSFITLIIALCVHILSCLLYETTKIVFGKQEVWCLPNVSPRALHMVGVQSAFVGWMDRWMNSPHAINKTEYLLNGYARVDFTHTDLAFQVMS